MRVFLWLVAIVAMVTGGLYGVGRYVLGNELSVTRTVSIDRPRAAIFAMANDLKIMREWSPYYTLDPDADYTFSGDGPGPGQTMRWRSKSRQVGSGKITLVRAAFNREVETIMELGGRATLNSKLSIARTEAGSSVAWSVSATCREGWINLPCRYMNLILERAVAQDLDAGLARLRTLASQLPDVDFEGLSPDFVNVRPQSYVYSPITTANNDQAQVDAALTLGVSQVNQFMEQFQLVRAGDMVRVTTDWNRSTQQMSFRVGYPFQGPAPLTVVGVQIGETPSGQAMRVVHTGPRAALRDTYAKAYAFLQAHRIAVREGGLPWEVLIDEAGAGDATRMRLEIYIPLQ
jgi:effector-binding domain-containing protein